MCYEDFFAAVVVFVCFDFFVAYMFQCLISCVGHVLKKKKKIQEKIVKKRFLCLNFSSISVIFSDS